MKPLIKSLTKSGAKFFLSISILIVWSISPLSSQNGWEEIFGTVYSEARCIIAAHDGNILVGGSDVGFLTTDMQYQVAYIIKMNSLGDRIWQRTFSEASSEMELYLSPDGNYIAHVKIKVPVDTTEQFKAVLIKFDEDGNTVWEYVYSPLTEKQSSIRNIIINPDGSIAFIGFNDLESNNTKELIILSSDGMSVIEKSIDIDFVDSNFFGNPSGGYYLTKFDSLQYVELFHLDASGNQIEYQAFPSITDNFKNPFVLTDGSIVFFQFLYSNTIYQTRLNPQSGQSSSSPILEGPFQYTDVVLLNDGFALSGVKLTPNSIKDGILLRTDFDGSVVWLKEFGHHLGNQLLLGVDQLLTGEFVAAGYVNLFPGFNGQSWIFLANENGDIYNNSLNGSVFVDALQNCNYDSSEPALEDWVISAKKGAQTFVTLSNDIGAYTLPLDTGSYLMEIHPPNALWDPCENEVTFNFTTNNIDTLLDFPIKVAELCPVLTISQSAPTLIPCQERTSYISYCNYGTDTAFNAYIDIQYDNLILPASSSLSWDSLGDNNYRFQLGDVAPMGCGSFNVNLFLDCNAEVGASYCMEAHAYPDSICLPDSAGWSGAFLEASGRCEGDDVFLRIENVGSGNMTTYRNYIIVEDILLNIIDSVELDSGDFVEIPVEANGSTYTLAAQQVEGAPGFSNPIAIVEGCGVNNEGQYSIGFSNQFPLNDEDPFVDQDCVVAESVYVPNSCQVYPVGYGDDNVIEPNTTLEFVLRFQNIGDDTSSTLVIRDTLDANLDFTSLVSGASSHEYDAELEENGILKFTFQNINLPAANIDEGKSYGFLEFRISPKSSAPLGTVIRNSSALYFDFREPVFTNETIHTIDVLEIEVVVGVVEHPTLKNIEVSFSPNPFSEETQIIINNHLSNEYTLEIFNIQGVKIRTENLTWNNLLLRKKSLYSGVYFYRISAEDGFVSTGSILVK